MRKMCQMRKIKVSGDAEGPYLSPAGMDSMTSHRLMDNRAHIGIMYHAFWKFRISPNLQVQ